MTMTLDEAVAQTQKFAALFNAVQVIAGEIKDVRMIEQMTRETMDRRDAALAELETAKGALDMVNVSIADAKDNLKASQEKAQAAIAAATEKAKAILDEAQSRASVVVAKARADGDSITAQARLDLNALNADLEALGKKKDGLLSEIDGRTADLADIEKKVAEARALFAQFLGAK